MKTLRLLSLVAIILFLFASVAAAAGPGLDPFSTTGYTTNLVPAPPGFPVPVVPSEFQTLPSGFVKFHISAQGGPAVDDDALCTALYGAPCQVVCFGFTGKACGTDGFFDGGSFQFEEWGVIAPDFTGPNYGLQTVSTADGTATMRFGGMSDGTNVNGSFEMLGGSPAYKKFKGGGTYAGSAGFVFTVDYTPAEPLTGCAVFGEDFKIKKDEVKWQIANRGAASITIANVLLNWPEGNGDATQLRLAGHTIYSQPLGQSSLVPGVPGLWDNVGSGWEGKDKDREIKAGQKRELRVQFANKDISEMSGDYTIVVTFDNGCAVPLVAFP